MPSMSHIDRNSSDASVLVQEFLHTKMTADEDLASLNELEVTLRALADWILAAATDATQTIVDPRRVLEVAREISDLASLLVGTVRISVEIGEQPSAGMEHIAFPFGQLVDVSERVTLKQLSESWMDADHKPQMYWQYAIESILVAVDEWSRKSITPAIDAIEQLRLATGEAANVNVPDRAQRMLLESANRRMEAMERNAAELLRSIKRQTTEVGETGLANAFRASGKESSKAAGFWSFGVFACVAAGIGFPIWALHVDLDAFRAVSAFSAVVVRVAVGLPMFALAAYCGHIAAQHRETARHMVILSAQLESIANFSNELPEDERLELRMLMGKRTFSDPGLILRDKGKVGASAEDLVELTKKVAEIMSAAAKSK